MRQWTFTVKGDIIGKRYANRGSQPFACTCGRYHSKQLPGICLKTPSRRFEERIRLAAVDAGVELMEACEIDVVIYYPTIETSTKTKRRVRYPRKGRPDISNVLKSVEDAEQKLKPAALTTRAWRYLNKRLRTLSWRNDKDSQLSLTEASFQIEEVKDELIDHAKIALVGAAVANDIDVLYTKAWLFWVAPDMEPWLQITITETSNEIHNHTSLHEWLKGAER